jgi:hypothetical protein
MVEGPNDEDAPEGGAPSRGVVGAASALIQTGLLSFRPSAWMARPLKCAPLRNSGDRLSDTPQTSMADQIVRTVCFGEVLMPKDAYPPICRVGEYFDMVNWRGLPDIVFQLLPGHAEW